MKQSQALQILKTGANVFLIGEPGSGKTFVINEYIQYLREHKIKVAVTASTGIAATHISGTTIHSWSGLGIRKEIKKRDLDLLRKKQWLVKRIQKTKVLIIDEVSMLDATVVSLVDTILKAILETDKPFGGLQVIFVGDFFQLPPITRGSEKLKFAFESESWSEARPVICYLSEQHRQADPEFTSFLKEIRQAEKHPSELVAFLQPKVQAAVKGTYTRLYTHNANVDELNQQKLATLSSSQESYSMTSKGKKVLIDQLIKGCLSPEHLVLKEGAEVMFTKNNYEDGFVNGTLGTIIDFTENRPVVKTRDGQLIEATPMEWVIDDNGKTVASITQIPLRLAWAITVHKSQGMTLDAAVVDLSSAFEYGQGYVAISRVKSLAGLLLLGINEQALMVHPHIIQADQTFKKQSELAVSRLTNYTKDEVKQKHQDFINRVGGSLKKVKRKSKSPTQEITLELYHSGMDIQEISEERGFTTQTIVQHLQNLKNNGKLSKTDLERVIPDELRPALPKIHQAFDEAEDERLSPIYYQLNQAYSYEELKLARLVWEIS